MNVLYLYVVFMVWFRIVRDRNVIVNDLLIAVVMLIAGFFQNGFILMAIAGYALGAFRCDPEFGEAVMWSDGGMYEDELGVGE